MGKEYHYTYLLTNELTGEFYYGSRTCKCNPIDDDYMGSMVTWKPNKEELLKEIIKYDFETRDDAIQHEIELIEHSITDVLNRNYAIPNGKFYRFGPPVNKGKKNPELSKRMTGKNHPNYIDTDISVIQYSMDGNFIKRWGSMRDAAIKLNTKRGYIKKVVDGCGKTSNGFIWLKDCKNIKNKISTDYIKRNRPSGLNYKTTKKYKTIIQYDIFFNKIKEWNDIELEILIEKYPVSSGYIFKYK
jgi:hypothetical protein